MNVFFWGTALSFLMYLIISSFISKRIKTIDDFFVAGRNAPLILIVGSMIASLLSASMFTGEVGEFYMGMFSPMMILYTIELAGYFVGAVYFGKFLRRSKAYSVSEFFGKRFCSDKLKKLASLITIVVATVYLMSVMQALATLMSTITNISYNLCLIIGVVVFAAISITSGSKGVLITDTIMFCIFTLSIVLAMIVLVGKSGGWTAVVTELRDHSIQGMMSWTGNLSYIYPTGLENILYGVVYGLVWFSVCAVGPWQSSRYLMAKNEHTVIRSSVVVALGTFFVQLPFAMSAVSLRLFDIDVESPAQTLIWAAMNILPTFLGVFLLTGALSAGVSSATTLLSLVGTNVSMSFVKKSDNKIKVSRIAMLVVSVVVLALAVTNPPQIFWIIYMGASIIASSWMPVAMAAAFSKRVTKVGAFAGMLTGFVSTFALKVIGNTLGITYPVYLDPVVVGMILNCIAMIIGSALTKVSEEEKAEREALLVTPESEKDPKEVKKTLKYMKFAPFVGLVITITLILIWVIPMSK